MFSMPNVSLRPLFRKLPGLPITVLPVSVVIYVPSFTAVPLKNASPPTVLSPQFVNVLPTAFETVENAWVSNVLFVMNEVPIESVPSLINTLFSSPTMCPRIVVSPPL